MDKYVAVADVRADIEWLRKEGCLDIDLREALHRIETIIPAAEIVAVIRCRDCAHAEPLAPNVDTHYVCRRCAGVAGTDVCLADDYCSHGIRKEDNT